MGESPCHFRHSKLIVSELGTAGLAVVIPGEGTPIFHGTPLFCQWVATIPTWIDNISDYTFNHVSSSYVFPAGLPGRSTCEQRLEEGIVDIRRRNTLLLQLLLQLLTQVHQPVARERRPDP